MSMKIIYLSNMNFIRKFHFPVVFCQVYQVEKLKSFSICKFLIQINKRGTLLTFIKLAPH